MSNRLIIRGAIAIVAVAALIVGLIVVLDSSAEGSQNVETIAARPEVPAPLVEVPDPETHLNTLAVQVQANRWYAGASKTIWIQEIERQEAARAEQAAREAEQARQAATTTSTAPPATTTPPTTAPPSTAPTQATSGRCGGDLPPCSVMMCESGGNIRAQNPNSSASGKWQFIDGTWGGYGGYARAYQAPEHVQDERARQVYAGGAGRHHWVC